MIPQTEAFRLELAGRCRLRACDPAGASGAFRRVTGAIRGKHLYDQTCAAPEWPPHPCCPFKPVGRSLI